jgi:outer membrane murein-binding lipoprotein Lpp
VQIGQTGATGLANAEMTVGLTINQGANDDEAFSLKSSDVAHGITGVTETDTYFSLEKLQASIGGVRVVSVADSGALSVQFDAFAVDINTTKTASARANFEIACGVKSGTGIVSSGTNANLFSVHDYGGYTAKFIVDQEGDFFYDGSGTAYDSYDDASLTRAMAVATGGRDIIRDEWDKYVDYNENDLVKAGVLGDTVANGGLVNGAAMQRLHTGAIWQLNTKHMSLAEEVASLRGDLAIANQKLNALGA